VDVSVRSTTVPLGVWPTPLTRSALGTSELWIKRDDLAGFGVAGNKTRPLELLLAEARERGAEVLVTGGGPDSNWVAAAALAARVAGLACELVVWGHDDGAAAPGGALALAAAAGARLRGLGAVAVADRARVDVEVEAHAARLRAAGRRPYPVPRGGATTLGAVGFLHAACELLDQWDGPPWPALVAVAAGSGASAAGLLAGLSAARVTTGVLAVSVSRPPDEIGARIVELAGAAAALVGAPPPDPGLLEVVDGRGPGFGVASAAGRDAARQALHSDGLLLDDTYGAKALAVLLARPGRGPAVYWHTGGVASALTRFSRPEGGA
jgi:D-cysteine desulfhydrase